MTQDSETFLNYRGYRWLWINGVFLLVLTIIYALHTPLGGPRGGTKLGYIYGGLATIGILYLTWYGARKRSYRAQMTTLKGCLAAHVWLGVSLAMIVPLHAGFHFGCNVHTLTYVVMMAVVISGIWGAFQFQTLPERIQSHRGGAGVPKLVEQIYETSTEISKLADESSSDGELLTFIKKFDFRFDEHHSLTKKNLPNLMNASESLNTLPPISMDKGYAFLKVVTRKRDLTLRLIDELSVLKRLKLWLYLHLPLTIALLVLLFIHIFSVIYY